MQPVFLADFSFLDVVWWMLMVFFWVTFLAMFFATFADIFRRDDLSGIAKALWIVLILVLPIIGILIYVIFRPAITSADVRSVEQARRMAGISATDDIAKAQELVKSGAITPDEYEALKRRALA